MVRIYDPAYLDANAYNYNGPRSRFDHHDPSNPPTEDPMHGTYYSARTLADCIVEVFGDSGTIEPDRYRVALIEIPRPLHLLELMNGGAWDAGTVAAVSKVADRSLSQAWARFIYSDRRYGNVDGISYGNAHNDAQAYALFERAGSLMVIDDCALSDRRLEGEIDDIAVALHMIVDR